MSYNRKPIPRSILIFGAGAHIGAPLARFLGREAPHIALRLATSSPQKVEALRADFPGAEVVLADFLDPGSLRHAVNGIEGVFMLTPSGTDERPVMRNVIAALQEAGSLVQMVRLLGLQPEASLHRIPQSLRDHGLGLPIQHPIAKTMLDDSGLPVTYINSGATFMDGLLGMREALRRERTLIWPERLIPYIHPDDIAETAGRLFLSDNHRHIGQFHTMNNGHDILRFSEVAGMMGELWDEQIAYDGSQQGFFAAYAQLGERRLQYLWDFFMYEQDNEVVWSRNDFVERMIGRKPITVRDWLADKRDLFLGS